MNFHEILKQLREKKGWTQNEVASVLNISKSTYVKYERGEREPRYRTLVALAELFQVSVDYLLGKTEIDSIYKENINEAYNYIFSDEFAKEHEEYLDIIIKFISKFFKLLYFHSSEEIIDILYVTTQIEDILLNLRTVGLHICCYDTWSAEDSEYKETVDPPTNNDFRQFIREFLRIRKLLDDYMDAISSVDYFENHSFIFEEEIEFESKMELHHFKTKSRNIPRNEKE